jgi:hypothetical protein
MDLGLLAIAYFLLAGKGGKTVPGKSTAGDSYVKRANQKQALDWIPYFRSQDMSPAMAEGLARWAGIESSGNPLALSNTKGSAKRPGGERGLLQCTGTTSEGIYSDAEWRAMQAPATRKEEHARLAVKLYRAMLKRARSMVSNFPVPSSVTDDLWYAKMWHARPKDFTDAKLHGPALPMARDLALRWADDPAKMGRLYSANVIAFGKAAP